MRDIIPNSSAYPGRGYQETFTVSPRTSTMIRMRNRDHVVPDSDEEEFYSTRDHYAAPRHQRVPDSDDDDYFSTNMERPEVPGKEDSPSLSSKSGRPNTLHRNSGTTRLTGYTQHATNRRSAILKKMKAFSRDFMGHEKRYSVETLANL